VLENSMTGRRQFPERNIMAKQIATTNMSRLAPIDLGYPAAGHRWAEGHASSPEGAVFLTLLAITAVVAPVIWLV
jgi:hypothetical protein